MSFAEEGDVVGVQGGKGGEGGGIAHANSDGDIVPDRYNVIERKNSLIDDLLNTKGNLVPSASNRRSIPIIVDLAFASNVRFLDDHELHLDNVELFKVFHQII
jgi:hypothetical protein